jgi:hypothetical protein
VSDEDADQQYSTTMQLVMEANDKLQEMHQELADASAEEAKAEQEAQDGKAEQEAQDGNVEYCPDNSGSLSLGKKEKRNT